jgi:hypothetical protein
MRPGERVFSASACTFYLQFTEFDAPLRIQCRIEAPCRIASCAMLNWLTGNCEFFGLAGQNWMLLVAGGLLLYIAVLAIGQRRQAGLR